MFHTAAFLLIAAIIVSLMSGFKPEEAFQVRWKRVAAVVLLGAIALVVAVNL